MLAQRNVPTIFVLFLLALLSSNLEPWPLMAQVIIPPQRADLVSVTVNTNVTFDSTSGLFTYSYEVSSAPSSIQNVWYFAVEIGEEIMNATSPRGWSFGVHDLRPIVSWAATEVGPLPPDFVDDGNVVGSPFQIKPGETLAGFSFQSPKPAGPVRFFAEGFTKLPQVTGDVGELPQEGEEILEFTQNSFRGTTLGPVSFIQVQIDIKPGSFPNSINPLSKGVIPVAILTTPTFDATTVNARGVRFGPGEAVEVHGTGHVEDVNGDGFMDLVLHFATQATGIRCGNTVASLTGKTFGGQAIQGTDSIRTVGCR